MVYVLSDIHGNERRFDSILNQLNLQEEDTLYILGDVIDRHPGGIRILQKIMKMPNVKMLLGNHEYMMLNALGCPYDASDETNEFLQGKALWLWHGNGGKVTHDCLKRIRKTQRSEVIEFLRALPLNIDVAVKGVRYKLVHGAPVEEYSYDIGYENSTQFAVWKRVHPNSVESRDYTLICGHTPTEHFHKTVPMELYSTNNFIAIDCGSGYPEARNGFSHGRLACIRLNDRKVFYSAESN